ncbi:FAD-binding oxidoreductase, partial [Brevibacterium paucivorans]|uniref:FAD-binding oxidoreductase n=1 Tax=Brevibacterium paucivorans TaxID=170994 RepID=UPI002155BBE7
MHGQRPGSAQPAHRHSCEHRPGDVLQTYSFDHAQFSTAGKPLALVRAQTVEDVQTTVRFAHEHGVPIVPQGARTGLAGAANAIDGCILLSLERMNRVLDVNTVEQTCTVEPGIINGDLKRHLDSFDMSYPPDPGSVAISSIGGN